MLGYVSCSHWGMFARDLYSFNPYGQINYAWCEHHGPGVIVPGLANGQ